MRTRNKRIQSLHGFTLIELLVVIAIISLLVSILLPSLNHAKALARQTVCGSNTRSINTIVQMYVSENNGFLPWWEGDPSQDPQAPDFFATTHVVAFPSYPIHYDLVGQVDLLHCPSSPTPKMDCPDGDPVNVDGGTADSLRNSYNWWRYDYFEYPWNPRPFSIEDIRDPASQFLLNDSSYRYLDQHFISYCHQFDSGTNGANVNYVDGHTAWVNEDADWQTIMFYSYYIPPGSPSW